MWPYTLTLACSASVHDVRIRVHSILPSAEPTERDGEVRLEGMFVRVDPPSDYPPSVEFATEVLGRAATAEVTFLVGKRLRETVAEQVRGRLVVVAATLCHVTDAVAALDFQRDRLVLTRPEGGPVVLFNWFGPAVSPSTLAELAAAGVSYHVSSEPSGLG